MKNLRKTCREGVWGRRLRNKKAKTCGAEGPTHFSHFDCAISAPRPPPDTFLHILNILIFPHCIRERLFLSFIFPKVRPSTGGSRCPSGYQSGPRPGQDLGLVCRTPKISMKDLEGPKGGMSLFRGGLRKIDFVLVDLIPTDAHNQTVNTNGPYIWSPGLIVWRPFFE